MTCQTKIGSKGQNKGLSGFTIFVSKFVMIDGKVFVKPFVVMGSFSFYMWGGFFCYV